MCAAVELACTGDDFLCPGCEASGYCTEDLEVDGPALILAHARCLTEVASLAKIAALCIVDCVHTEGCLPSPLWRVMSDDWLDVEPSTDRVAVCAWEMNGALLRLPMHTNECPGEPACSCEMSRGHVINDTPALIICCGLHVVPVTTLTTEENLEGCNMEPLPDSS